MEVKNCPEYIIGFCPHEEFYVDGVTIKCPYVHSERERNAYKSSKEFFPFEKNSLAKFKEIISDLDHKIRIHSQILKHENINQDLVSILYTCQKQIDLFKKDDFDPIALHNLLVLHGKLLIHSHNNKTYANLDICYNCSVFKQKNSQCEHKFCKKYDFLRKTISVLEKKISVNSNSFSDDINNY